MPSSGTPGSGFRIMASVQNEWIIALVTDGSRCLFGLCLLSYDISESQTHTHTQLPQAHIDKLMDVACVFFLTSSLPQPLCKESNVIHLLLSLGCHSFTTDEQLLIRLCHCGTKWFAYSFSYACIFTHSFLPNEGKGVHMSLGHL